MHISYSLLYTDRTASSIYEFSHWFGQICRGAVIPFQCWILFGQYTSSKFCCCCCFCCIFFCCCYFLFNFCSRNAVIVIKFVQSLLCYHVITLFIVIIARIFFCDCVWNFSNHFFSICVFWVCSFCDHKKIYWKFNKSNTKHSIGNLVVISREPSLSKIQ